ncbi:MAG TPA: sigma-70 family RNA polymerase sigma factor [Streptosporangiaceae bacterium]|nr:sigma-70 family RNA polymerase sigma factor [Streptosporangiaceae bacterium]
MAGSYRPLGATRLGRREDGTAMRDDFPVARLVARARDGDKQAWDAIVDRYAPLIWSICRRYRLDRADADDVGQSVWLRLVDQLAFIREPAALPGWIATTTRRECTRVVSAARRREALGSGLDAEDIPDDRPEEAMAEVLAAERNAALREAFGALPPRCRRLLALLIADPPVPYAEISDTLGIAVGSIGPSRARCLDRVRHHPAVAALINADEAAGGDPSDQPVGR